MSKSTKRERTLSYNRVVGALHLRVDGVETGYWLDALAHQMGAHVRCFRLAKIVPPADGADHYDVVVGPSGAQCECRGFLRWGRCKHVQALRVLIERGDV